MFYRYFISNLHIFPWNKEFVILFRVHKQKVKCVVFILARVVK